ncbi:unnamed protein product, partial [Staurois parvus]
MQGHRRPLKDIVNAGSRETRYSESRSQRPDIVNAGSGRPLFSEFKVTYKTRHSECGSRKALRKKEGYRLIHQERGGKGG